MDQAPLTTAEMTTSGLGDAAKHAYQVGVFDVSFVFDLVERGGPVVVIILVLSIVSLAVALYKFGQFLSRGVGSSRLTDRALARWFSGERNAAVAGLQNRKGVSANVLAHAMSGVAKGIDEVYVREDAERVAQEQLGGLRANLRVLEATSQLAPLLGLFGTVIGMMGAFQALQASGADADPAALAGGIWIALTTTAVGLAVAIPAAFALYWFEGKIDRERTIIESSLTSLFTSRLNERPADGVAHSGRPYAVGDTFHAA